MLNRTIEHGLTDVLKREGIGIIAFAPLANGLLTGKYLDGIPEDSRMAKDGRYLKPDRTFPCATPMHRSIMTSGTRLLTVRSISPRPS